MTPSPRAFLVQKVQRTREAAAHTARILADGVVASDEERTRAVKWLNAELVSLEAALDEVFNP